MSMGSRADQRRRIESNYEKLKALMVEKGWQTVNSIGDGPQWQEPLTKKRYGLLDAIAIQDFKDELLDRLSVFRRPEKARANENPSSGVSVSPDVKRWP